MQHDRCHDSCDDASPFDLGRRTVRDCRLAQKVVEESCLSWAGVPNEMILDCGGEFISNQWKDFLQRERKKAILTAAPWQRGRIFREAWRNCQRDVKQDIPRSTHKQPIASMYGVFTYNYILYHKNQPFM